MPDTVYLILSYWVISRVGEKTVGAEEFRGLQHLIDNEIRVANLHIQLIL